ncbi:hypothetical protein, partial [Halorubrum sp. SP3]|uniref:hypothetical protein n=1 Tax=Halorubrum sp. SP3 TaxID=1537265 RepID=UPI001A7E1BD2
MTGARSEPGTEDEARGNGERTREGDERKGTNVAGVGRVVLRVVSGGLGTAENGAFGPSGQSAA